MQDRNTSTMSRIHINAYGATDTGRKRDHNEDRFSCDPGLGVYMVIDGVGGYAAGEVAAELARELIYRRLQLKTGTTEERLREAITAANNEIYAQSQTKPTQCGMACVLTAAVIEHGMVTVGHVGDTRLYEIRDEGIRKITRDHSLVGILEDAGEILETEAMNHPQRSEILRDVGSAHHEPDDENFVDIYQFPFRPASALLLCSDGLTDLVPQDTLERTIRRHAKEPEKSVRNLIKLANNAGGLDNITVIVVEGDRFEPEPHIVSSPVIPTIPDQPATRHRLVRKHSMLMSRPAFLIYGLLAGYFFFVLPLILLNRLPDLSSLFDAEEQTENTRPRTLFVEDVAGADYRSITEALRDARSGDIVTVAPGVYNEKVILRDSIAIISTIPGTAVLHMEYGQVPDSVAVVGIGVRGARLEGFVIDSTSGESPLAVGIYLMDAYAIIEGVTIHGTVASGILIDDDSDVTIYACVVTNNEGVGVHLKGLSRSRLVQNIISGNGAPGVLIESEEVPLLINNTLLDNAAGAIQGLMLSQESIEQIYEGNFVDPER